MTEQTRPETDEPTHDQADQQTEGQAAEQTDGQADEQTEVQAGDRETDQPVQDELVEAPPERTPAELQSALEALLLIADEPVSETQLAAALGTPTAAVNEALSQLAAFYDETGRGFELRQVAGGWRYYTREQHAELLKAYVLDGQQAKLSQAALETLAVIAYLQPVSRSRVSAVRGVSVDGVMRTLLARDLITEVGAEDSGATLFATTDYFLERMGLQSLDELPELAPYLPEATELEAELGQLAVVPDPEPPLDDESPADDESPVDDDSPADDALADSPAREDVPHQEGPDEQDGDEPVTVDR